MPVSNALHEGDHPRVCGEHHRWDHALLDLDGSSPRMRGALAGCRADPQSGRIIPAYAGSTFRWPTCARWSGDHPRVCGEHEVVDLYDIDLLGSSPRMRRAPRCQPNSAPPAGIIPAYAGSTTTTGMFPMHSEDHPRVCGEYETYRREKYVQRGSSPRMRGAHHETNERNSQSRIIPAYAGSTHILYTGGVLSGDHPRVCGEHPTDRLVTVRFTGSSPRMRGAQA